jgi:predicted Zn-dependent protease
MILKVKKALLWSRAIGEFRAGRTDLALDLIDRMKKISPLRPFEQAYLAQIYIWRGESEKARPYILAAIDRTSGQRNENDSYVNVYARVIKNLMDNEGQVELLIDAARTIKCRQSLRRWLPLSKEDTEFSVTKLLGIKSSPRSSAAPPTSD